MFKRAISMVRDRKKQAWMLLFCLISYLIPASVAAGSFFIHHGTQKILALIISLVSTEIGLVLSLGTTVIQASVQIFCMCKGRPLFPSSRGKRLGIILLNIALMQMVQGTTGAVGGLNSFVSQTLPFKNDFKSRLSAFTWPALVASGLYTLAGNLTVNLAISAGTTDDTEGDVETGGNNSPPFLPLPQAFPSPLWSLVYRGLQFSLALCSLFSMTLASDYQNAKPFVILVWVLLSHCLWSGSLAIVGLCTIWGYSSQLLQKPFVRGFVYFGDLIMMGILLHAVCGAASIVSFLKDDLQQCYMNNCEVFIKSTRLAFASHMTLFLPTIYTTVMRVYT